MRQMKIPLHARALARAAFFCICTNNQKQIAIALAWALACCLGNWQLESVATFARKSLLAKKRLNSKKCVMCGAV